MPEHPHASTPLNSSQLASIFLQNNTDSVVTLNLDGQIVGWNPGAEKLYGYSEAQIANHPVSVLFPTEVPGEHLIRRGNLTSLRPVIDWKTQQISRDGSEISMNVSVFPLFDEEGKLAAKCLVARELSAAEGSSPETRQVQKLEAVGRLAGGIAHEFNNLLTVISGYNSLLRSSLPAESPLLVYAGEVETAADRAAALTSQLLVFSRRAVTAPEVLNLNLISEDLKRMLERIIGDNVKIELNMAKHLENIKGDPGQISQMLMNLAINARDAMPDGGVLCIKTSNIKTKQPIGESSEGWAPVPFVQIEISDTGTGMDEQTREHVFEPFFTTKSKGKGTGLGLSIVYGIVSRMRGQIHVTSELGKGTCFTLSFPATFETDKEPGSGSFETYSKTKDAATGSTILLVEDEDTVRLLVKEMLLKLGHEVIDFATAEEAIGMSAATHYDLVLTDLILPEMNGSELALHLQKARPDLKVLFMSGYVDDSVLPENFLKAGVNFLLKPFTAVQLAAIVQHTLQLLHVAAD